jgi:O-methyltransferase domain
MAIDRVITRELLDHLPSSDARAARARRDLRAINALMGNVRWIRQGLGYVIENSALPPTARLVELGAGDGGLCRKVVSWFPTASVTGLDLAPRPRDLPERIAWRQGDLLDNLPDCEGECIFGTMILHHFRDDQLASISGSVSPYRALCFCEPWRARFPHLLGLVIRPLCGSVARHDLPVSIDAGFVRGELPRALGLKNWKIRESIDWRGSLRLIAWKG